MFVKFTKMHGLGNDFVVIDATQSRFEPDAALLARLTDRHFGVGCDQVLVVDSPTPEDVADGIDFGYRIYNADGSQVGQCGNGARCLARFVADRGLSDKKLLHVRTITSTLELQLLDDGMVRVDLGIPRLEPSEVPLSGFDTAAAKYELRLDSGSVISFGAVGMGNPHAVIAVGDVDTAPVAAVGEALQHHAAFPERVNVGFIEFVDASHARLRVYERGAGETLACGSGACAAMVVGRLWKRLAPRSEITLAGGSLLLEWAGEGSPITMTGPAEMVFEGTFEWAK
jgi:diaminopimelate epimerase